MTFLLRTDNHIRNSEDFTESVRADLEAELTPRYGDRLRRVEVYLEDVNSGKGGGDTRCAIEIHLAGLQPFVAEGNAADPESAIEGALHKVLHLMEHHLGRLGDRAGHTAASGEKRL
jgi:hypothetical protein